MSTAEGRQPQKRVHYLDGLRGLAALCVVVGHAVQISQEKPFMHPMEWLFPLRLLASLAVPTFIVLSGYVITLPIIRANLTLDAQAFLIRRAKRILPAYYFALAFAVSTAVLLSHTETWYVMATNDFISSLFLTTDWIGRRLDCDRPLWSLPIEWHIYSTVPVLVYCWRRFGILRASVGAIAFYSLTQWVFNRYNLGWAQPQFYILFVLRALAAWITHSSRTVCRQLSALSLWPALSAGMFTVFAAFAAGVGKIQFSNDSLYFEIGWGAVMFCALVALATDPSARLRRILGEGALYKVGQFSYSLYLLHWPILVFFNSRLQSWHTNNLFYFLVLLALGLPTALGIAYLSYLVFERRYLRARRSEISKIEDARPSEELLLKTQALNTNDESSLVI